MTERTVSAPTSARRLLWVEGKDDNAVIQSLAARARLPQLFRVQEKNGVDKLLDGLRVELRARTLERFGIVVDANGDPQSRWESIRAILTGEGYADVPLHPPGEGAIIPPPRGLPLFGAWLMPDNGSPGALEEFVTLLIPPGDALLSHASVVVDSIPAEIRRFSPLRRQKALIRTWLAWQEDPGSPMGQAITKGDLDARAPAAQRLIAWLRRLMLDESIDASELPAT